MEAIHDSEGRVVGWRRRMAIFDRSGKPRAFISRRGVFSYKGAYLGRTEDGWYRDRDGHAVAFEGHATGAPMRPVTERGVAAPLPDPDPPPPTVEVPPAPRMRSSNWSPLSWEAFLKGKAPARR